MAFRLGRPRLASTRGQASLPRPQVALHTFEEIALYALRSGRASPAAVLDSSFQICDLTGRNRVFGLLGATEARLVLKQGECGEAVARVAREARIYTALHAGTSSFSTFLAGFHGYDADHGVLLLEWLTDARDLGRALTDHPSSRNPCKELGRALGLLHGVVGKSALSRLGTTDVLGDLPAVLGLTRPPPQVLADYSAGQLRVLEIVQRTKEFGRHLEALREEWRPDRLIHNDLRAENCLVIPGTGNGSGVRIIDWELAGRGDPAWDTGSVFALLLAEWVASASFVPAAEPARFIETTSLSLERLQRAARSFWRAYCAALPVSSPDRTTTLERLLRWTAARLLQTAVERCQWETRAVPRSTCLLHLALNFFRRPRASGAVLLGLSC